MHDKAELAQILEVLKVFKREYTEEVLSEEEILKEKEYVTNVCMVYEKTKIEKIIRFEVLKLPKSKKKGRDRSTIETLLNW